MGSGTSSIPGPFLSDKEKLALQFSTIAKENNSKINISSRFDGSNASKFKIKRRPVQRQSLYSNGITRGNSLLPANTKLKKSLSMVIKEDQESEDKGSRQLAHKTRSKMKESLFQERKRLNERRQFGAAEEHLELEYSLIQEKVKMGTGFDREYGEIKIMKKEKLIRLRRCVGVESLDAETVAGIEQRREEILAKEEQRKRQECRNRTELLSDRGLPVYFKGVRNKKPNWEEASGDFFSQKNSLMQRFRNTVTRIIIQIRTQKR